MHLAAVRARYHWLMGRTLRHVTLVCSAILMGALPATAQVAGTALRGHWGIEDNLHWQLDVTFGEDANQVGDRHAAENLSSLRRLALSLLKRHPSKKSVPNKRYTAALDVRFLEEVLIGG